MRVLAGDIGGTHARLAVVEVDSGKPRIERKQVYDSKAFTGLEPIALDFIAQESGRLDRACFGVACPIAGGECETPNLPWKVSEHTLAEAIGIPHTLVVNDLHAIASGISRMTHDDMVILQEGRAAKRGVIALIGAGTGLGQAFLAWDGDSYRAFASEGGHSTFAPRTELEWELQRFLSRGLDHVSCERVVSGPGIVSIYQFLAAKRSDEESPEVRAAVEKEGAVAVSRHALGGGDRICADALDMFVSAYGAQAGNLALDVLATGGVYLVGGIAKAMADRLQDGIFITAFREKGRLGELLSGIPVRVVVNPHIGLLGAAVAASQGREGDLPGYVGADSPPDNDTFGAR